MSGVALGGSQQTLLLLLLGEACTVELWVGGVPWAPCLALFGCRAEELLLCGGAGQGGWSAQVCSLTSLLHSWAGASFPGLGFPGVLWLPEVSALPSWYPGLVPISWWLSDWGVTAGDQLLGKWLCAIPGLRGTGPGLEVRCLCARKPRALSRLGWGMGSLWRGLALGLTWEC